MSNLKGIIPAAGYGKRMNMQPDQAKEMLIDPVTGKYLIDYHLDLCYKYNIEPVVISRIEKSEFNSYLRSKKIEHIVLKEPGKEWADTVLKSQGLWGEKNLLLLPDTRFEPEISIKRIVDSMHEYKLVAGVHDVPGLECDKWGIISREAIREKPYVINPGVKHYMKAWGILGFNREVGQGLFSSQVKGGLFKLSPEIEPTFVHLDKFVDITRSGKLEKY